MLLIWPLRVAICKVSLGEGIVNFKILFLNILYLAEFWRDGSVFFHCMMVDGKKASLKKSSLKHIKDAFSLDLVLYISLQTCVNRVKTPRVCLSKVLSKHQNNLCYRHSWRDSRSSFPCNFYLEVTFIGTIKAEAALYYIHSKFL